MIAVALVVILLVLLVLSLPFLLDLNRYRDHYLPVLEQVLHRKVDVQDVRLTLYPTLGVELHDVVIADDPAFSSGPFLIIPSMQAAVQWKPLLQRRIQIDRVMVEGATMQVIRSTNGDFNISTVGKVPISGRIATKPSDMPDSVSPWFGVFAVKQFSFSGGTLHVEDRFRQPARAYQIEHLALNTESVAIGKTAHMKLQGRVMPYEMPLSITGRFGPIQENLDIPDLKMEGLFGTVTVTGQGSLIGGQLVGDIQIPKLSAESLPLLHGLPPSVWLSEVGAHFSASMLPKGHQGGSSEIQIDPLRLNLHLGQSHINLSGKGTPRRLFLEGGSPAIASTDLPVSFPVHQPFMIEQVAFSAEILDGEQLKLQSLTGNVLEGRLTATGTLARFRPPLQFSTKGMLKGFSAEALMKVWKPGSLSITGTGEVEWNVTDVMPFSSTLDWSGHTQGTLRNGELIGFDLVKAIEDALQVSGVLGESTGTTTFSTIDVKAELKKDGLVIREITAHAPNFSLRSEGKIGLDQSVHLQGQLSIPPALADTIIRRFPMAQVVRHKGQLVLPFVILGTVQAPALRLDTQILGKQVQKKVEERLEKVLQGDDQELQKLLDEGKDLLKHFFRK